MAYRPGSQIKQFFKTGGFTLTDQSPNYKSGKIPLFKSLKNLSPRERLYAIGEKSRHMVRAFGYGAKHFSSRTQLIDECREIASPNVVFLIKGSRGSRMEAVMKKLRKAKED